MPCGSGVGDGVAVGVGVGAGVGVVELEHADKIAANSQHPTRELELRRLGLVALKVIHTSAQRSHDVESLHRQPVRNAYLDLERASEHRE